MAKRKKSNLNALILLVIVLCGVAAFVMLFLNALKKEVYNDYSYYTGLEVVFGKKTEFMGQSISLKFNILSFLAYFLPLIAVAIMVVLYNKKSNLKYLIAFIIFTVSAVLMFIMPTYVKVYYELLNQKGATDYGFEIAVGTIVGGICSGVGALTSLFGFIKK